MAVHGTWQPSKTHSEADKKALNFIPFLSSPFPKNTGGTRARRTNSARKRIEGGFFELGLPTVKVKELIPHSNLNSIPSMRYLVFDEQDLQRLEGASIFKVKMVIRGMPRRGVGLIGGDLCSLKFQYLNAPSGPFRSCGNVNEIVAFARCHFLYGNTQSKYSPLFGHPLM